MDRQDNWLESEHHFFDATTVSESEWNLDTRPPCDDEPKSDVSGVARSAKTDTRSSTGKRRFMRMGLYLIRV